MSKQSAKLKNATINLFAPCITGEIYNDSAERFTDGTPVRTSKVNTIYVDEFGRLSVETRNTIYTIESGQITSL